MGGGLLVLSNLSANLSGGFWVTNGMLVVASTLEGTHLTAAGTNFGAMAFCLLQRRTSWPAVSDGLPAALSIADSDF
jgi:hypothetical protein